MLWTMEQKIFYEDKLRNYFFFHNFRWDIIYQDIFPAIFVLKAAIIEKIQTIF